MATDTDPLYYIKYGRRCMATYDSFQIALDLVQDQRLSLEELGQIITSLKVNYGFTSNMLVKSFEDLIKRHHSEFVAEAFNAEGDKNHRIELTSLRIGGERSHVVMSIEKQTISLPVFKGQEV